MNPSPYIPNEGEQTCSNCGRIVEKGVALCPNCGAAQAAGRAGDVPDGVAPTLAPPLPGYVPLPYPEKPDTSLLLTKSETWDSVLGFTLPFLLSIVLSILTGIINKEAMTLAYFGGIGFITFPGLLFAGITYLVIKDKYPVFGGGLRKTLKVCGILMAVGVVIVLGLFLLCIGVIGMSGKK